MPDDLRLMLSHLLLDSNDRLQSRHIADPGALLDDLVGLMRSLADWNSPEDAAYDRAEQVPCSTTVLRQFGGSPMFPHRPHPWAPQPGMTPAWCPGTPTPTEES